MRSSWQGKHWRATASISHAATRTGGVRTFFLDPRRPANTARWRLEMTATGAPEVARSLRTYSP